MPKFKKKKKLESGLNTLAEVREVRKEAVQPVMIKNLLSLMPEREPPAIYS